jgi:hydroxymethylglutaryl-CoA synthase
VRPRGIVAWGAYIPVGRLARADIAAALGVPSGRGARAVACHDEDTTSMGVEAARRALWASQAPRSLFLASTAPAYADKTNATSIHAALGLDAHAVALDMVGAVRSAVGALGAAATTGGMAVLSDIRIGRPGSADEREGGDGAAAFLFGDGDEVAAEVVARASTTAEFLDRWRAPGDVASSTWEERFGLTRYLALVRDAVGRAVSSSRVERPDHVVVSCPLARVVTTTCKGFDAASTAANALAAEIGYLGAADAGVRLAHVLDRAQPGETILVVSAADGCDAVILRATDAIGHRSGRLTVREQVSRARPVSYQDFLTWRGLLPREPPRRPDPVRPAAPPSARSERWKFALTGSRCGNCQELHLPPQRVCSNCAAVDTMREESVADREARIVTYTLDRLAYSLAPPTIDVVLDFDHGGRYACQLTESTPDEIEIGSRVEMTFRRLFTAGGVHNYFWKARPVWEGTA